MLAPSLTGLSSGTTLKDSSAFSQLSSLYGEFLTKLTHSLDDFYKLIQHLDQPEAESLARTISDTAVSDCETIDTIPPLSALKHWDLAEAKQVFNRCRKQMQDLKTKELILVAECLDDLVQAKIGPTQTCFDARWEKAANDKEKLMQLCIAFYKKTISRDKRHLIKDAEGFFEITRDHVNPGEVKKKKIVQLFRDIETERGKGGVFWKNYQDDREADQEVVVHEFAQLTINSLDEREREGLPKED
jgi:hypothetical protein